MNGNVFETGWKIASPVVYPAGFAPVLIGTIVVITLVERRIGFWNDRPGIQLADLATLRYNGDALALATIFLLGGVTFGFLAIALSRFEGLVRPSAMDHLRHCVLLYVSLCPLAYLLAVSYESQTAGGDTSNGYVLLVLGFVVFGYAILVDAIALLWQRRSGGTGPEVRA